MEENETISGEDAKRIIKGQKMEDCYNVNEVERTLEDDIDMEVYNNKYPTDNTFRLKTSEEEVEDNENENEIENENENDYMKEYKKQKKLDTTNNETEIIQSTIANLLLKKRLDEEKQIFEILLKEDLEKKRKENQNSQ